MGVRILNYLDDWLILAQSREQLGDHRNLVLRHLSQLGLQVNWEKSKLSPVQRISFLGVELDSVSRSLPLCPLGTSLSSWLNFRGAPLSRWFSSPDGEPWWNPPSTPGSQTGRMSVWPDSPSGNPICVFFHGKVSLTVNPYLPCDRASVRFCGQPSSLLLGRICPRVQSYVVLPQAWASPYQCLHMLPPFGQDVASVAPFSGRLASLPLRQARSSVMGECATNLTSM